jgi:hypothetical protein
LPKQQLFSKKDFDYLKSQLERWGFHQISSREFCLEYRLKGLKAPRAREGREVGFVFKTQGLKVIVWTTWLEEQGRSRKSDAGWVLISNQKRVLYFSHPIHRTKNFILHLLQQAYIARQRVITRPCCPDCGKFMNIARGKGIKSRYWVCARRSLHQSGVIYTKDWDCGINNPKIQKYLDQKRKARKKYYQKRRAQGKKAPQAILIRKPWQNFY